MAGRRSPPASPIRTASGAAGGDTMRPGRALLGWLADEAAHRLLCSGRRDLALSIEAEARLAAAWECARSRRGPPDPSMVVTPLPEALRGHEAALRDAAPPVHACGYELCLVDLSHVCALAQAIVVERAVARTASARDPAALAALTVPVTVPPAVQASFDEELGAWVVVSDNPNVRLVGSFRLPADRAPPGTAGLGFMVRAEPSWMTVAHHAGRYFLEDGYHRAVGLLSWGINVVPALVHDVDEIEALPVRGMLGEECWAGPHPALLPDYLDDAVSIDVWVPGPEKIIIVQGLELDGPDTGAVTYRN